MIRISALASDTDSSSSDEDDSHVTQEAQETIALSEYMRALRLKNEGQVDVAESLFVELLETRVLNEATKDAMDNKLFHVKYSCLKNLGLICADRGQQKEAIQYLLQASELDDKDVALMNRLGKLALVMDQADIAQMAFETCLRQNPNHWPAADGMLRVLCLREDIAEAYGWAIIWYEKNPNYQFGLDVILEIREKFQVLGMEYIERLWKNKFVDTHLKRTNMETVFPKYIIPDPAPPETPDLTGFHLDESNLSWLGVGKLIVRMYQHFEGTSAIGYDWTLDEWLGRNVAETKCDDVIPTSDEPNEPGPESNSAPKPTDSGSDEGGSKENSSSNTDPSASAIFVVPLNVAGGNCEAQSSAEVSGTEESDGGAAASATTAVKPKASRRRAFGDLIGLEQWGWHRNKRYSQRKKSIDKTDPDTTVNGMLRKALSKFYEEQFDADLSPFASTYAEGSEVKTAPTNQSKFTVTSTTVEAFHLVTQDGFVDFMTELKERPYFDLMVLARKWCQCMARYWDQPMPEELREVFKTLYKYHLNHWDIDTWNHLERKDFQSVFRMTLFYLELVHDSAMRQAKDGCKNELDQSWKMLFNHFIFHSGYFEPDAETETEFSQLETRWHWLKYLQARYENDLDLVVDFLYAIEQMIVPASATIYLPNLGQNNRIDLPTIAELKVRFERNIRLSTIRQLYRDEKFEQMVPILVDSLQSLDWNEDPIVLAEDSTTLPPTVQFEMLLECFWQLESPGECIVWCEASLGYSVLHFLKAPPETHRMTKWGESVTFVLTYLVGLFEAESASIVEGMGRFGSRLVQNIVRTVVHQLDSPYDKNNNPPHAIDIKLPWVLLHKLIQRDEDLEYAKKRRSAYPNASNPAPIDGQEEVSVPVSTILFFKVHEFLGVRAWCTQNDAQVLLYIMDTVADNLRTPAMDRHRDVLAEYLEQVTYCLYGYPAKRARARHIEEHDACNIELTWPRALQLFDLYRPDTLPEFNSYKNDSISADMEQLLQRIIALLPAEIEPATEPINSYITGSSTDIATPDPSPELLPQRILCIYYLLADHYFKNRDLVKSVKYYVLDLATCPDRFDAWAGLALSKASILETKLNACTAIATNEFLSQCEESLRCFQQCFRLDNRQVPLWIEYGNFAYIMHSFCSRSLKQASETLSMERFEFLETNKEQCLKIAADCFNTVNDHNAHSASVHTNSQSASTPNASSPRATSTDAPSTATVQNNAKHSGPAALTNGNHDDSHDEKWLYHYMLGKVAEKRKDPPEEVIAHYIESAKCLYEHNASFPFKISHSNPQHLSVEALEVYYRITATIVKYLEQHATIPRMVGRLFIRVLREVNASPFALNQAKIDDFSINALKRKISMAADATQAKKAKEDAAAANEPQSDPSEMPQDPSKPAESLEPEIIDDTVEIMDHPSQTIDLTATPDTVRPKPLDAIPPAGENQSPSRRGSQESNMTTTTNGTITTTTTTTGTSDSSSSSSSDSSSSESVSSDDSDEDSTDEDAKSADTPLSENELESIYKTCIKNLEECVTRFPEHYKSIYRLVNIYLHAPDRIRDLKRCKQLLLGTYTTGLGNQVQGLFVDRKLNNFFNGVWRIPSTEIDRPGSFAAHLSKCTIVLMEVLRLSADHKVLLELALQLQRNPDSDKRYIKDAERRELFQQAISFCTQSFRQLLKEHGVDRRNDGELILLLLDTYKAHKKYLKYTAQKECPFAVLLSDAYRVYLEGKLGNARLPDQFNATEYAIRFCQHEMGLRKNLAKNGGALPAPAQPESFLPAHVLRSIINTSSTQVPAVSGPPDVVATPSTTAPATLVQTNPVCTTVAISGAITVTSVPSIRIATTSIITPVTTSSTLTTSITSVPIVPTSTTTTAATSHAVTPPPRPRGRPPGSKNSAPSAASTTAIANSNLMSSLPYGKLDPATLAAIMGIYSNPALLPTMVPQYTDPAVAALLSEYYQLSGMSSLMAGSNPTNMLPTTSTGRFPNLPPTSAPSQLPMFDINSLISSAAEKMNPPSSMSPSTVISIGSGQLTITPSTVQPSSPRSSSSNANKSKKYFNSQLDQMPTGPSLFADMPGMPVNKVKPPPVKQTSLLKPNVGIPKDLPKSLTITPAPPLGIGSSQSASKYPLMQFPQVTMQPEPNIYQKTKAPKPQGRSKKPPKNNNPFHLNPMAAASLYNPYSTPSTLHLNQKSASSTSTTATPYTSTAAPYSSTTADYNQHMAVMAQYADLLKNIDPVNAAKMLAQFEQYSKFTTPKPGPKPPTNTATFTSTSNQPATKGRLSVKQLQSMQNQPHTQIHPSGSGGGVSMSLHQSKRKPSATSTASTSGKQTKGMPSKFTMPMDLLTARSMTSPFLLSGSPGGSSGGSPAHAHSPLKSPTVLPPPLTIQPQMSPSHGQISPSKTLQQILAERQKALNEASIKQQMQQHQRSESGGPSSGGNKSSSRKTDNIIILD